MISYEDSQCFPAEVLGLRIGLPIGYAVVGLVAGMLRVAGKVGAAEQEDAHEPVAGRACPGLPAAGFGSIAWGQSLQASSFVTCLARGSAGAVGLRTAR